MKKKTGVIGFLFIVLSLSVIIFGGCLFQQCPTGESLGPDGECHEDGIYCAYDALGSGCNNFYRVNAGLNKPSCTCEANVFKSFACLANDQNTVPNAPDTLKNSLCMGPDIKKDDKCCSTYYGGYDDYLREVVHDCLPGKDRAIAGRAPPKCWASRSSTRCQMFPRVGSTADCQVVDYYGICFQPCSPPGTGCDIGKNQCCPKDCQQYAPREMKCYPTTDPNDGPNVGTCLECPPGQVACGEECFTPDANHQCCANSEFSSFGGIFDPNNNRQSCCIEPNDANGIARVIDPYLQCCNCPDKKYLGPKPTPSKCWYDAASDPNGNHLDQCHQCERDEQMCYFGDLGGGGITNEGECYNPTSQCCDNWHAPHVYNKAKDQNGNYLPCDSCLCGPSDNPQCAGVKSPSSCGIVLQNEACNALPGVQDPCYIERGDTPAEREASCESFPGCTYVPEIACKCS